MTKSTLTFDETQQVKAVLPKTGLSADLQNRVYLALLRGLQLELAAAPPRPQPPTQLVGELTRVEHINESFLCAVPIITAK